MAGIRSLKASFVLMILAGTLGGLSQTAVNTAMPSIMADLSVSVAVSQWLVTVFQLSLGVVIPFVAFLVSRYSMRRLFLLSLAAFAAGSFCILIANVFILVCLGRILQAVSFGVMLPFVQIVAMTAFPPHRRGFAMGIVGVTMGFAPNVGPTIAGYLTTSFGWRSSFMLLAVFAAFLLIAAFLFTPEQHPDKSEMRKLDMASALTSAIGFGGLIVGISNASDFGIVTPHAIIPFVVGITFLVYFFRRQATVVSPLIDLRIFSCKSFVVGTIVVCLIFMSFIGVTLLMPLAVQQLHGFTALQAGLIFLPGAAFALVVCLISGALMDRFGPRYVTIVSAALAVLGTLMITSLGENGSFAYITIWQTVRTIGISALIMPVTTWSLNALPSALVADGTSVTNTFRQIAAALGTASMVFIATLAVPSGSITAIGVDVGVWFSFALFLIILLLLIIFVKNQSRDLPKNQSRDLPKNLSQEQEKNAPQEQEKNAPQNPADNTVAGGDTTPEDSQV